MLSCTVPVLGMEIRLCNFLPNLLSRLVSSWRTTFSGCIHHTKEARHTHQPLDTMRKDMVHHSRGRIPPLFQATAPGNLLRTFFYLQLKHRSCAPFAHMAHCNSAGLCMSGQTAMSNQRGKHHHSCVSSAKCTATWLRIGCSMYTFLLLTCYPHQGAQSRGPHTPEARRISKCQLRARGWGRLAGNPECIPPGMEKQQSKSLQTPASAQHSFR